MIRELHIEIKNGINLVKTLHTIFQKNKIINFFVLKRWDLYDSNYRLLVFLNSALKNSQDA